MRSTLIDLGPNNDGSFGPSSDLASHLEAFGQVVADDKYRRQAGTFIRCIDGRALEQPAEAGGAIQLPGSLVFTNTAADLMDDQVEDPRLSQLVAYNTAAALKAGFRVAVHGDDMAGPAGCAANAKLRQALHKNYDESAVVVPLMQGLAAALGKAGHEVTADEHDIITAIEVGKEHAGDDEVWDIDAERATQIACDHGAAYERLLGSHQERAVTIMLNEDAYDGQAFAQDHRRGRERDELFVVSAGRYVQLVNDPRKAMRGLLFAIGLAKTIGNAHLPAILLS